MRNYINYVKLYVKGGRLIMKKRRKKKVKKLSAVPTERLEQSPEWIYVYPGNLAFKIPTEKLAEIIASRLESETKENLKHYPGAIIYWIYKGLVKWDEVKLMAIQFDKAYTVNLDEEWESCPKDWSS